jgi:hypothetical protein
MEVAGANRRCRCGCNPRRESAVAQLFSLGGYHALYEFQASKFVGVIR